MKKCLSVVAIALAMVLGATTPSFATVDTTEESGESSATSADVAVSLDDESEWEISGDPVIGGTTQRKKVVNKKTVSSNYINKGEQLASCTALTSGVTCSITKARQATRTIQTTFGITRDAVASSLSISSADSVTVSIQCSSPVMKKGQTFKAWPSGKRFSYQIKQETLTMPSMQVISSKTSTTQYAFNPTGVACGL